MGGKRDTPGKCLLEYLGDFTLEEIAIDYYVSICYLVDALCTWDVPDPILTIEQSFTILEAINSLNILILQDWYSNQSLLLACDSNGINLKDDF